MPSADIKNVDWFYRIFAKPLETISFVELLHMCVCVHRERESWEIKKGLINAIRLNKLKVLINAIRLNQLFLEYCQKQDTILASLTDQEKNSYCIQLLFWFLRRQDNFICLVKTVGLHRQTHFALDFDGCSRQKRNKGCKCKIMAKILASA